MIKKKKNREKKSIIAQLNLRLELICFSLLRLNIKLKLIYELLNLNDMQIKLIYKQNRTTTNISTQQFYLT